MALDKWKFLELMVNINAVFKIEWLLKVLTLKSGVSCFIENEGDD